MKKTTHTWYIFCTEQICSNLLYLGQVTFSWSWQPHTSCVPTISDLVQSGTWSEAGTYVCVCTASVSWYEGFLATLIFSNQDSPYSTRLIKALSWPVATRSTSRRTPPNTPGMPIGSVTHQLLQSFSLAQSQLKQSLENLAVVIRYTTHHARTVATVGNKQHDCNYFISC